MEKGNATNSSASADSANILKERQMQYLGFTSRGFINNCHNILIKSWEEIVNEFLMTKIVESLNLSDKFLFDKNKYNNLRDRLYNRVFQHGKLDLILNEAQEYLDKHIFNIPENIKPNNGGQEGAEEHADDEDCFMEEIEGLEVEILNLRIELELINGKDAKIEKLLELMAFVKSLEKEI